MSGGAIYRYNAFGLAIRSAAEAPELPPDEDAASDAPADIVIEYGDVPDALPGRRADLGVQWDEEGRFLVAPWDVRRLDGRMLVEGGARITLSPAMATDGPRTRIGLLLGALPLAMYQRGLLPLHGSAVAVDGRALVLTGPGRRGKSTASALLESLGHTLLTDDMAVVERGPPTELRVRPGPASVKLWGDSARFLGVSSDAKIPSATHGMDKAYDRPPRPAPLSAPLGGIVLLGAPAGDPFQQPRALEGREKLAVLLRNSFRSGAVAHTPFGAPMLEIARIIATTVPMWEAPACRDWARASKWAAGLGELVRRGI